MILSPWPTTLYASLLVLPSYMNEFTTNMYKAQLALGGAHSSICILLLKPVVVLVRRMHPEGQCMRKCGPNALVMGKNALHTMALVHEGNWLSM